MDLRAIARALGGEVASGQVLAPAPGHSPRDRSMSVRLSSGAPSGLVVWLFTTGDVLAAKDYVLAKLGLRRGAPPVRTPAAVERAERVRKGDQTARALEIWEQARSPFGSPVERYLRGRGLALPECAMGEAVRFHPCCPFGKGGKTPAMVSLVRDVLTDEPKAIHRTAIDVGGRKVEFGGHSRLSLGPVAGGAVKLTPDSEVAGCLGVGEGLESALSLQLVPEFGSSPVWSLISAGGIERLPVLAGIESLWLAVDHDKAGLDAAQACGDRWSAAGVDVYHVKPCAPWADLNDVFKRRADA